MSVKVFLSVGDISAANYLYEILKEGFEDFEFLGITNTRLESIGIKSVGQISELSVVGIAEVLPRLLKIRRLYKRSIEVLRDCDVLIACDAPGFNLRLIKEARRMGVEKVVYFISPQVWAWKPGRAKIIAEYVDDLIVILPFEVEIYRNFESGKFKVHYVGHPLVDMVKPSVSREEFYRILGIDEEPVNLMPGSRWGEVKRHSSILKEVVKNLQGRVKDFILPTFEDFREYIEDSFSGLPVKVITDRDVSYPSYNSMFYSKLSIVASGTSSLEAALAYNPHIVFYSLNPLTYMLARFLVRVEYVSLPNLILNEEVIPELINKSPSQITRAAITLLEEDKERERMRYRFGELKSRLGGKEVIVRLRSLFRELLG
ncbi:lipid-A-disaccharide synthase [Hydrogenivirga caldilitoris]|uniref:Lipid-A-disaccharide synthase n=1 Tax=Hydrogenivirga caldilitoris TaxID=246264 RepID=A0A497XUP5_9AQUI|nr:lipid-A-disaccharide synthase [Hydrogenivirga caldilitoris]RLJ70613.1 lipid-A-disaccharide synthase [Hydrogenivirga caldilitoris]